MTAPIEIGGTGQLPDVGRQVLIGGEKLAEPGLAVDAPLLTQRLANSS